MKFDYLRLSVFVCLSFSISGVYGQITERKRPEEWKKLVYGARFIDRFLPMPDGKLSSDTWGAKNVLPRYIDNGIEDSIRSYWGGNIMVGEDGKYHLFVCGWPENSPRGHATWPNSTVYHAVSENSIGPFVVHDTVGRGHNPEIFRIKDGRYIIYVIDGYYISDRLDGPWRYGKFEFNNRDRRIIEGLSNLTFAKRDDGSFVMVCRGGGIWISQTGLSAYNQLTDKRVYPAVDGEFEDPVIWKDHIQYHLIVNDWLGRIAFYLRSKDGVSWVTDPGEAYQPGISFHKDGKVENWFKYERIKILQDSYGRAVQANFAVIDVPKESDKGNDAHSSKNISIPLNPGLLLTILDSNKITSLTKTIRVGIKAEKGFNPHTDLDVASLRFGASAEVNFGRGCRAVKTQKDGADLIVTFDAAGNGITDDEFAPKLIGRSRTGTLVFGYARLPWVTYINPVLSARIPKFSEAGSGFDITVEIQNFGQVASVKSPITLEYLQSGKKIVVGKGSIPPLSPYEKTEVRLLGGNQLEKGKEYDFVVTIPVKGEMPSLFHFTTTIK